MSNLKGSQPKVIPEFTGLQVNTAVQVLPIPLIYGAPRININLIYYNGFIARKVKTGGGKGNLTGGKGSTSIEYYATIILALGEGTIGETFIIYQDANVYVPWDYPNNGAFFYDGSDTQPPWPVISYLWPYDARPYKNTAYWGFYNARLDASATVPQIDLVVRGHLAGTCPLNDTTIVITSGQRDSDGNPVGYMGPIYLGTLDADPAAVIWDFLTNDRYGATFPPAWIDTSTLFTSQDGFNAGIGDAALSTYCQAVGFGWSVVINNVESASSIMERWLKNLNVAAVWNGETLQFIPYWDAYADANPGLAPGAADPKYYNPARGSIVTITLDDIMQTTEKDADPIAFMRKDPTEVYNTIRVDYKDRYNFYNDVPAEAKDEAHVELYGPRIDNIGLANEFSHVNYATMSSLAQLRRNIGIMRTYTWKMNPLWAWLRPMDIITIPDPTDYTKTVGVRVTDIEDDEDENITVTAEEFGAALPTEPTTRMLASFDGSDLNFRWGGANSPTFIPTAQSTPPNQGATNNPPQPAYPPVTFEPTTAMLTAMGFSTPQIIFGCSGGAGGTLDPNWGGVDVWISLDNISYELMGRIIGAATCGFVTSAVPAFAGANPDVTHTIYVSLMQSDGELASSTDSAASAGHSICVMQDDDGFEAFAYVNATLSSPFTYILTGLYRGLYGTTPRAFAPGAKFMFVGSNANFLAHNLPAAYIGQNFWVKPQSFNTFYIMEEDLSDVTAYRYFVGGPTPGFSLSDNVTSHDQFTFAGQYVRTLQDLTAAVDAATSTSGLAIHVSDSAASADALTP